MQVRQADRGKRVGEMGLLEEERLAGGAKEERSVVAGGKTIPAGMGRACEPRAP